MIQNIFSRSPFLVKVGVTPLQTASKLELFLWKKGEVEPGTASYVLTKKAASTTQTENYYDIAPFVRENIINGVGGIGGWDEETYSVADNWCNVRVKTYYATASSFTQSTNTYYTATNGYTNYQSGINGFPSNYNTFGLSGTSSTDNFRALYRANTKIITATNTFDGGFISLLLDYNTLGCYFTVEYKSQSTGIVIYGYPIDNYTTAGYSLSATGSYLIDIPYTYTYGSEDVYDIVLKKKLYSNNSVIASQNIGTYQQFTECKYAPVKVSYIGQAGGVETITFFKAKEENISVKATEYSKYNKIISYGSNMYYNQLDGQTNDFNVNGSRTLKVNTGWVDEVYKYKIQDLMLSEYITSYDGYYVYRVQLKTKSMKMQTNINDKTINYSMEFDISSNIINNLI